MTFTLVAYGVSAFFFLARSLHLSFDWVVKWQRALNLLWMKSFLKWINCLLQSHCVRLNGFSVAVPVYFLSFFAQPFTFAYTTHTRWRRCWLARQRYICSARIDQWIWLGNQLEFARDKWWFCVFIFAQLVMEFRESVWESDFGDDLWMNVGCLRGVNSSNKMGTQHFLIVSKTKEIAYDFEKRFDVIYSKHFLTIRSYF